MSTSTIDNQQLEQQADNGATSSMDTSSEVYTGAQVIYDTGTVNDSNEKVLEAIAVTEKQADEIEKSNFDKDGKTVLTDDNGNPLPITVTIKNKKYVVTSVSRQSAILWKANTLDGITKLSPNDEETCNLFNTSAKAKQIRKFNASLIGIDDAGNYGFKFQESPVDMAEELAEVTSRRMSPSEKMLATAKSLPPEQLQQVIAALEQLKKLQGV